MNDKYARLVYEFAVTRVKSNSVNGARIEQTDLHWKELTDDVNFMMRMICLMRQIRFYRKCGQDDAVAEKQTDLEALKKNNEKLFEVAHYFDTQKHLNILHKEVSDLKTQIDDHEKITTELYDEVQSKKRKTSLVLYNELDNIRKEKKNALEKLRAEKMAEFNKLAESIGLISHFVIPTTTLT